MFAKFSTITAKHLLNIKLYQSLLLWTILFSRILRFYLKVVRNCMGHLENSTVTLHIDLCLCQQHFDCDMHLKLLFSFFSNNELKMIIYRKLMVWLSFKNVDGEHANYKRDLTFVSDHIYYAIYYISHHMGNRKIIYAKNKYICDSNYISYFKWWNLI